MVDDSVLLTDDEVSMVIRFVTRDDAHQVTGDTASRNEITNLLSSSSYFRGESWRFKVVLILFFFDCNYF